MLMEFNFFIKIAKKLALEHSLKLTVLKEETY